jgi:glycosyltransferase involved in cell wall biosynthesis
MFFSAHFPPCPGGISKFMGITAQALAEQGCKVIVVTSDFANPTPSHKNITLVKLPIHKAWPGSARYPVPTHAGIKELLEPLGGRHIDKVVALTRFHPTSHIAATFARKNHIPLYVLECGANPLTLRSGLLDPPLHLVERILTTRIKKAAFRWGAMSQAGIDFLKKQYDINGTFIWPCSIEVASKVVKTTTKDEIVITYSGRIENLKGEEELAHSFVNLLNKYPHLKLNFLGDGSYLPVLKRKYTQKNIKYWGNVTPDLVNKVNLASDIFVCATRFPDGAVPNAVLEAGAAKCAGITSPNGGFTDLIEDGRNGLLTRPDLSDMEECLERLIVDEDLRHALAEKLHADIAARYRPDMVATRILHDLDLA